MRFSFSFPYCFRGVLVFTYQEFVLKLFYSLAVENEGKTLCNIY